MRFRHLTATILVLLLATIAAAQDQRRQFTVEDLWKVKRVSGPALSPDGKWLAVTVSTFDMETNEGSSDIWLVAADGSETRRLTADPASDSSPAWSPDGKTIAFISGRDDGPSQIYLIRVDGGEAWKLTDIPTGASGHKWSADGKKIYFVSNVWQDCEDDECNKQRLEEEKESKVKAHATESPLYRFWNHWLTEGRVPHLFVADAETGEHKDLFAGTDWFLDVLGAGSGDYDVSPDGTEICFTFDSADNPGLDSNDDLYLLSLEGGEVRKVTDNPASDGGPIYSPDGKYIAYGMSREKFAPDYRRIALYDRGSAETRVLTDSFEFSCGGVTWNATSDTLFFTAGVKARSPIFSIATGGGEVKMILEGHSNSSVQLSPDGQKVYFSRQSFSMPPTIFGANTDGTGEVQLSHFNDELLADIAWHSVEEHYFEGADGDDVQILLLKPAGFDPAAKWPLVHMIHGGPHGAFGDSFHFRWNAQLFGAPGYVVACVNFHGSSGFRQNFFDSIAGAEGGKPYEDVMKGTDYLLGLGYIDEKRMAATGGSYGGYLVNWIATQNDRFACLVSHAGNFNHHGMFASDTPRYRERRWGGFPWDNQESTDRWSPNRFAANIETPMLIIHGDLDYRVVVTQGLECYNTLKIRGVPARLLHYPDEGHWIQKPQNSRLWYNEVHTWFERWIGHSPSK